MKNKLKILFYCLFLLIVVSCKIQKEIPHKKTNIGNQEINQIIFLNFKISKTIEQINNTIELLETLKSEGSIKKKTQQNFKFENSIILQVYNNKVLENTIEINHPLFKEIEFLDEKNILSKKNLDLATENFTIRFQSESSDLSIKILERLKNNSEKELLNQKI